VVLSLSEPVALSSFAGNQNLGRFVVVDGYDAAGCGIVQAAMQSNKHEGAAAQQSTDYAAFEEELFTLLKKYFPGRFEGTAN
jgi:bifunctional enzyme CysN/CysC/sulfate adenylyltransferase subunit 1